MSKPLSAEELAEIRRWSEDMPLINTEDAIALLDHITHLEGEVAQRTQALRSLVTSLDDLITSSEGVYGLHLNGDGAPWDELTAGGRFHTWLEALDEAREALPKD